MLVKESGFTERTRETGIRQALGAQAGQVKAMVMRQGMKIVAVGLAVGLLTSLALTSLIENLLFGVSAFDTTTFALATAMLAAVAIAACYIPARRATRVDPLAALRHE
jgi:putative ABC transport system permease protein